MEGMHGWMLNCIQTVVRLLTPGWIGLEYRGPVMHWEVWAFQRCLVWQSQLVTQVECHADG